MGASASHPSHGGDESRPPVRALHVLRVTPGSPASQTDIEPFFDFVVGVDGVPGGTESTIEVHHLEKIVEAHEGKTMNLIAWSSKSNTFRLVPIIPSRIWATPSSSSPFSSHSRLPSSSHSRATSLEDPSRVRQPSLLGLSMRLCAPELSLDNVWHILEVLEGSPAESAGLVPYGDWIIGWSGGVLRGENDFLEVVEAHVDRPLRVYVYSYDFDTLREVVLVPNRMWGGEGLLGCGVGFGLLHRIPEARPEALFSVDSDGGGEMAQDLRYQDEKFDGEEEPELFVPADDIIDDDNDVLDTQHSHPPLSNDFATPGHRHNHNSNHIHHHKYPIADEVASSPLPTTTNMESTSYPSTGPFPRRESPALVPSHVESSVVGQSTGWNDPPPSSLSSSPSSRSTSVAPTEPLPDISLLAVSQLPLTPPPPSWSSAPGQLRGQNPSLRQFSSLGTNRLVSASRTPLPNAINGIGLAQETEEEEEDGDGSEKRTSNGSMTSVDD